jgi:hypothetical protein
MFKMAFMPASMTGMPRAVSRAMIASRLASISGRGSPRRPSLAPSSRITPSGVPGIDQSSRARPMAVVSPETPALSTATSNPSARNRRSRQAGKAWAARRP